MSDLTSHDRRAETILGGPGYHDGRRGFDGTDFLGGGRLSYPGQPEGRGALENEGDDVARVTRGGFGLYMVLCG